MAETVRWAARGGLVGGVVAVYLVAVGIFERFTGRNVITGRVTLGWLLLGLVVLVAGAHAARSHRAWWAGAVAGALASAILGAFILLASAVPVRSVLVNVSPRVLDVLTLGRAPAGAALLLVVAGALVGLVGAGLRALPQPVRRPVVAALTAMLFVALLEPLLRVMLVGLGIDVGWLYRRGGLTTSGAVTVALIAAAVATLWQTQAPTLRGRVEALEPPQRRGLRLGLLVVALAFLLILPQLIGPFLSEVAGTVGLFVLLGIGLNIVVGSAGMLHLGYVAFFAAGAYTSAILTSPAAPLGAELSFWAALPIVIIVAAFVGLLVGAPVLRLRGDYLAIVTLAFGEIARILVLSDWLRPALGGAQGILAIPAPTLGGFRFRDPQSLYYLILIAAALAAYVSLSLENSRVGRAWTAMREDEQVAEIMGINISRYKLLAFALGAGIGSVSGALFAVKIGSVFPHSFSILVSITALSVVILGGIGSLRGVIVGAAILVGLPDLLREFGEYRLLIYGALLVAVMILRPQGLLPDVRRSRELHEEERLQDQWLKRTEGDDREPAIVAQEADPA